MATHFICHSTEPLPHTFPTTGSPPKAHGAVSQYEVYNAGNKSHTQFPPPGWDFSQTSEEDSLPLMQPQMPQPEWRNSSFRPDPDLCFTPLKKLPEANSNNSCHAVYTKPNCEPDPMLALTPLKPENENDNSCLRDGSSRDKGRKQHVRFELENSMQNLDDKMDELTQNMDKKSPAKILHDKPYQPELYGDEDGYKKGDSQQSVENGATSRTVAYTVGKVNNQSVYIPLTKQAENSVAENEMLKSMPKTLVQQIPKVPTSKVKSIKVVREKPARERASKTDSDPIAACRLSESDAPKRNVKVLRENQYTPKQSGYTFPFSAETGEFASADEHMFARPEYNSTLRMKVEAEKLKASDIDVAYALQKKLTTSDVTKASISEKAASLVNSESKTFSGLVSLSVPADEICKQAAEMKTVRAKQTTRVPRANAQAEPDLLEFFTPDRQKENATLTLSGIASPCEQLSTSCHWRAFDLYKHNRMWDGRGGGN